MKFTLRDLSSGSTAKRSQASRSDFSEGTGSPEGVVVGKVGDIYSRLDGSSGTTIYFKESGHNTNTGWKEKGVALTSGGTSNSFLIKNSATDYDVKWETPANVITDIGAETIFNGLEDSTKFALSYNVSGYELTVTYSSGAAVWVGGVRYPKTGSDIFTAHANTSGKYYCYYGSSGEIVGATISAWDLMNSASLAVVYYNATTASYMLIDERHPAGTGMDNATHKYLHTTRGTQTVNGFSITGYTLNTGGAAALSYSVALGVIADEDLITNVSGVVDGGPYRILWRVGVTGEWTWSDTSTTGILDNGTNIVYNQLTGGAWQQTAITSNSTWMNYYVVAIQEYTGTHRTVVVMGQATYASLALAQAADPSVAIAGLSELSDEFVYLYRMTYRRVSGNTPSNAQLTSVQGIRSNAISVTGGFSPSDHQTLTNRAAANAHPASSISTDTTNFNNNLSGTDTTVQIALDTIDNFVLTRGWINQQIFIATEGQVDFTITLFTIDANSKLTVLHNGVDLDEGSGYDWVRDVGSNKITLNTGAKLDARIKIRIW